MQIMTKRTFNTISILCEDNDDDADDYDADDVRADYNIVE